MLYFELLIFYLFELLIAPNINVLLASYDILELFIDHDLSLAIFLFVFIGILAYGVIFKGHYVSNQLRYAF